MVFVTKNEILPHLTVTKWWLIWFDLIDGTYITHLWWTLGIVNIDPQKQRNLIQSKGEKTMGNHGVVHGIFHGISWHFIVIQWDINGIYPLVNAHITMETSPFLMGTSTINEQFSIAMLVYRRLTSFIQIPQRKCSQLLSQPWLWVARYWRYKSHNMFLLIFPTFIMRILNNL